MEHKRYSEEKIVSIPKEHEAGASGKDLAPRLREVQAEKSKLNRLPAEAELGKAALKELLEG